ncbi:hypothetical protein A2738_00240 [Candidatus Nomurabacteria bacterium RIFCSPHIGHO2_01_FULL_42_15]|uniref:Aspartyl/glutamyl-tRNA(Asn/Gln) amidotransferase subunit C n=1 Tax=Candidatus Nomurabacteria bacterium RIFCSPHIGHO2_01_FULL_42_15 TaxID=1801742 RepID=A0A1F6VGI9_9BACT|nr:MAG: hypothetical protein A2738_00240 [Candidatus Nomurabacteria bacterium RIFCSPHIGHO2_01_FULL_42_15]OGI92891.1 MAG: hypothetical protein A3A99_02500 [Candidatus Nomurabacteria bacterium RIFCSPLOWO2_01_FULL_41_18]
MDIKDVENLALLARIELSEEEKKELLSDMKGILDYVKQIESVKVEEVESEYDIKNAWREDVLRPRTKDDFSLEIIKEQFPDSEGDFLKVKKIL